MGSSRNEDVISESENNLNSFGNKKDVNCFRTNIGEY